MNKFALLLGLAACASAMELTQETWDEESAGKTVFIKFQAPWCGHCKSMKPAWDKLVKEYEGSKTALVADVDCTAEGKELCETHGVQGFPTIKYGDPSDLQKYEGGRDFDSLQKFAKENLKPMCSPNNIDLCDADKKKEIEALQALSAADLDAKIEEGEKKDKDAETHFESEVKNLQATYEKLQKEKEEAQKAVKESGLGLAKAVRSSKKKNEEL